MIGYGSTRTALGSPQSIAVGRTSSCQRCGNAVIGSTGQLWQSLISHRASSAPALYFGFFVCALWHYRRDGHGHRHRRAGGDRADALVLVRSTTCSASPLALTMISVGLLWRQRAGPAWPRHPELRPPTGERAGVPGAEVVPLLWPRAGHGDARAGRRPAGARRSYLVLPRAWRDPGCWCRGGPGGRPAARSGGYGGQPGPRAGRRSGWLARGAARPAPATAAAARPAGGHRPRPAQTDRRATCAASARPRRCWSASTSDRRGPTASRCCSCSTRPASTVGFAKLGTGPLTRRWSTAETAALRTLAGAGADPRVDVPRVLHAGAWRGLAGAGPVARCRSGSAPPARPRRRLRRRDARGRRAPAGHHRAAGRARTGRRCAARLDGAAGRTDPGRALAATRSTRCRPRRHRAAVRRLARRLGAVEHGRPSRTRCWSGTGSGSPPGCRSASTRCTTTLQRGRSAGRRGRPRSRRTRSAGRRELLAPFGVDRPASAAVIAVLYLVESCRPLPAPTGRPRPAPGWACSARWLLPR